MGIMTIGKTGARNSGGMWRLIAVLVLLAFSFQSYLAQTHIHEPATTVSHALIFQPGHNKAPASNTPLDCPFCQAVAHASNFLLPGVLLLFLVSGVVEPVVWRDLLADKGAITRHNWQSRAPPSH